MPDGYLISVGVKADFSELKTQQKEATAAVKEAKAAWEQAYSELGQAAEKGSVQAQTALKEYEVALDQAVAHEKAAQQALATAQRAAYEKRIQQSRDYQEYLKRESAAQDAVGAGAAHMVPQFSAASGALRELQGNFDHNIRAAERFLSTTLGLGPILQAAFPLVGALAFAGVIFEMGKSLVKFGEEAEHLSVELGTGWLDAAILQLSGFSEKVKAAEADILHAQQATDHSIQRQKEIQLELIRLKEGPAAEASARGMMDLQEANRLESLLPVLRERLDIAKKMSEYGKLGEAIKPGDFARDQALKSKAEGAGISTTPEIAREQAKAVQAEIDQVTQDAQTKRQEASRQALETAAHDEPKLKNPEAVARKADEERLRADEVAFNRLKISHELTLQEEEAFWQKRLTTFGAKTSEYATITAKLAALYEKGRTDAEKQQRQQDEFLIFSGKLQEETNDKIHDALAEGLRSDMKAREDAAEETAKAADIQATETARLAEAVVQHRLATGAITAQDASVQIASIHAEEYRARIKALTDQLSELQEIESLGGNTRKKQTQVGNQLASLQGAAKVGAVADSTTEAKKFEQPWVKAFDTVSRQWMSVQDEMLRGQISVTQGAKRMASQMLLDTVHSYEQMFLTAMRHEVMAAAAHETAEAQKTAATEVGTGLRGAAETRENLKSIFGSAKSAAAGAYKAMAGIPIIGPELGAIAAAASFAGVMALAAFEKGGIVGGSIGSAVPIMAHAGERVLTVSQTKTFERMVGGSQGSTGSSLHYAPTINGAGNDKEIKRVLKTSGRELVIAARRALRNGH